MRRSELEYLDQATAALQSPALMVRKAARDSLLKYALTGTEQEAMVNKILRE